MKQLEWPDHADPRARNPLSIEEALNALISRAQVTLLGELDLAASTDYEGLDWSMYDLATFCMQTDTIRTRLESGSANSTFAFPAVLAVWAVARAQELEDGDKLWATAPVAKNKHGLIGPKFREAIQALGLEDFSDHLNEMQQYVALARMHAIVPTYALRGFVERIRRGYERHQHAHVVYQDLVTAAETAAPVRQLLLEKPDLGLDLVTRAIRTMRIGADSGLPPRLTAALLDRARGRRVLTSRQVDRPVVKLSPTDRQLYLRNDRDWTVLGSDEPLDRDNLPASELLAVGPHGGKVPLLWLADGYLMFDSDLSLTDGRSIPSSGGVLLWGPDVRFDTSLLSTEPDDMVGSWEGWQFAYIHPQPRFEMSLPNGALRVLSVRNPPTVEAEPVRWVKAEGNLPVFGKMPRLSAGQSASAIDHITEQRRQLGEGSFIHEAVPGPFDVTVYAALGRSRDIKGFFIPDFRVEGCETGLLPGEQRDLVITSHPSWKLPKAVTVVAGEGPVGIVAEGPDGQRFDLKVEPNIITWSVEFTGLAPEYLSKTGNYRYEKLSQMRRLVLHGLGDSDDPQLAVWEAEKLSTSLTGSRRDAEQIFDLRTLMDARRNQRIDLKTTLAGKSITLASFHPRERLTRIESLSQLKETVLEKGWFTEEQWRQVDVERERESIRLRNMHRQGRWSG